MNDVDARVNKYLAQVIYDAGRYDDAADIIIKMRDQKYEYNNEEKQLPIKIYDSLIGKIRNGLDALNSEEETEKFETAKKSLIQIIKKRCDEIIDIINNSLLTGENTDEDKVILLMALSDFERYKLDCMSKEEQSDQINKVMQLYKRAQGIINIMPIRPIDYEAEINLKTAIIKSDYLGDREEALSILISLSEHISNNMAKVPVGFKDRMQDIHERSEDIIAMLKEEEQN